MPYTIIEPQPAPRPPAMLSTIADENGVVPYDVVAPGLYKDEVAVQLDTGELVAVSVQTSLIAAEDGRVTGGGMEFRGWVRQIDPEGKTVLDVSGHEIELETTIKPTPLFIATRATEDETGEDRISREFMRLLLGEEPTMIPIDPPAVPPPPVVIAVDDEDWRQNRWKAPPGTILNPEATEQPLIGWDEEISLNNNIRHVIAMAARASGEHGVNAAQLLA